MYSPRPRPIFTVPAIVAGMLLASVAANPANAAGEFDGEWVGKVGAASGCGRTKLVLKAAVVKNSKLRMTFENHLGRSEAVEGDIGDGTFNEWGSIWTSSRDNPERPMRFKGKFEGTQFTGHFGGEIGYRGYCSAPIYLGKKGTADAIAAMSGFQSGGVQTAAARAEAMRLAELRAKEEARIAALRAEQEKIAAAQQAERARLEEMTRRAERQAQELARLRGLAGQQKETETSPVARINFGNYHALVIGINDYKDLPKLKTAVADANAVADRLSNGYGFSVTKLINPTRDDILDTLDDLRAKLTFRDNLLIYYAGHGWLDKESDRGYWLPVNAKENRRSRWVSNATITDTLKALKSKHVMVVADSCYSGRLVRSANVRIENVDDVEFYKKAARKKARVVITSGGLEPVEDGKGHNSPFAREFLRALDENNGVLDGNSLYRAIRRPVMVNTNQTPQYSDVRRAGHDGGDFLLVRQK